MLTQLDDDGWKFMVACASCFNNKTKTKYNSYEGECLTIVWAFSSFRCYLYGSPFTMIINHQPLKFLMELYWFTRKLAIWAFIFRSTILILFIRLVGIIEILMGWVRTQVPMRRIPHVPSGMERWIWRQYQDGMPLHMCVLCWDILGMCPKATWVVGIPTMMMIKERAMALWTSI